MNNFIKNKEANLMIEMISCALNGKLLDPFSDDVNERSLFNLCQLHKVSALASLSLKNPGVMWNTAKNDSVRRTVLFDIEREQIFKLLEKNRIWYCPLKGIVLKDFYPEYGIREMVDNDILF